MICRLNLIEVLVITALLAIMIGFAVGVIESMMTTWHVPAWLAIPAGITVALVVVGGPVAILSLIVHHLDRRLERRLKSRESNDAQDSEE